MKATPSKLSIQSIKDYPLIKKLSEALWQKDTAYHGAAIMIGSGFSRCGAVTGDTNKKLPLWGHLFTKLKEQLQDDNISDALLLAEVYSSHYGKHQLLNVIKEEMNEQSWNPTSLYKDLLQLPWSEVLTTNWDTLLERAAQDILEPSYSTVDKPEDLTNMRSPRITKLHGTIGRTDNLIFTQEDFRTYPQKYAAFVNFARQVFIENELCLLGFSGEDPNFLQWAGWIRDHLGNNSRRIYLVGALNLSAAKRKYFEGLNIAVVDLYELVVDLDDKDARHEKAITLFLQELKNLCPQPTHTWKPECLLNGKEEFARDYYTNIKDPAYASLLIDRWLPILTKERESYPDWLICPLSLHSTIGEQITRIHEVLSSSLKHLITEKKEQCFYEIVWRYIITYDVPPTWLARELIKVCNPPTVSFISRKQLTEIAFLLLNNYDYYQDDIFSQNTKEELIGVIKSNFSAHPEIENELTYYYAVNALNNLDYPKLNEYVDSIKELTPSWKLKKAALLAELARYDESENLIKKSYSSLAIQCKHDKHSIYLKSRLAWAHYLLQNVEFSRARRIESFPIKYKEYRCDPFDILDTLNRRIDKHIDEQREVEADNLVEHRRTIKVIHSSNFISCSYGETHPVLLLKGIINNVGIPINWENTSLLRKYISKLTNLNILSDKERYTFTIRASNSDTSKEIKNIFQPIRIACTSPEIITQLITSCFNNINYWSEKRTNGLKTEKNAAIHYLRIFIEILARMLVSSDPMNAKKAFRAVTDLIKEKHKHDIWLFDAVSHVFKSALKAIPTSEHHELLLDSLTFPINKDIRYPNPVINYPGERTCNEEIDMAIKQLIACIKQEVQLIPTISEVSPFKDREGLSIPSAKLQQCLIRLYPLIQNGYLNKEEGSELSTIIDKKLFDDQKLPRSDLYPHAYLQFSSRSNESNIRMLIQKELNDFNLSDVLTRNDEDYQKHLRNISNRLRAIVAAAQSDKPVLPTLKQSIEYFNIIMQWRPRYTNYDVYIQQYVASNENEIATLFGELLARAIIPMMATKKLTQEHFDKISLFYKEIQIPELILAFAYFVHINKKIKSAVEQIILQGLKSSSNNNIIAYSSFTVLKWSEVSSLKVNNKLIEKLIFLVEFGHNVGLTSVLWTLNELLTKDHLKQAHINTISAALPAIFDTTNYSVINPNSQEIAMIPHIRSYCIKLASNILSLPNNSSSELSRIVDESKQDPLPEVRFALDRED